MPAPSHGIRDRGFADFRTTGAEAIGGHRHWLMRGQSFWLEWVELGDAVTAFGAASDAELLVIAAAGRLRIVAAEGALAAVELPAHSVGILPAGRYRIAGEPAARCAVFTSQRSDTAGRRVLNAAAYETRDPRIPPPARTFRRRQPSGRIAVMDIGKVMASEDKPRLKMLQTDTLSINIVEYEGPRTRSELSPHSHDSFEQGSLAIAGDFVHHLRTPWGSDADQWREDEHLPAGAPSLAIVPPGMVHTSEGVGPGHHFLVDLFSPPRADFIANGWVFNAGDYEATAAAG